MTQLSSNSLNLKKGEQLVYFFLNKAAKKQMHITKLRLIKWIYLAERESYKEFGEPLIGDRLCSIKHGPVPSETLAIVEGKRHEIWRNVFSVERQHKHQYIRVSDGCIYSSEDDLDRFSDAEMHMLESLWNHYGKWSSNKLEKYLHDKSKFPEWKWTEGDKTNWIELETLLSSVGFSNNEIPAMVEKIVAFSSIGN